MKPIVRVLVLDARKVISDILSNASEADKKVSSLVPKGIRLSHESKLTYHIKTLSNHLQGEKAKAWWCEVEVMLTRHNPTTLRVKRIWPSKFPKSHELTVLELVLIDFMDSLHLEDASDLKKAVNLAIKRIDKALQ